MREIKFPATRQVLSMCEFERKVSSELDTFCSIQIAILLQERIMLAFGKARPLRADLAASGRYW